MKTGIFSRLKDVFPAKKEQKFPREITMRNFYRDGCKFEISGPVEAFRIEEFGGEEEFTGLILEEVKSGDVFFDIGACVGLVSVHAARKGARAYSFEPDPYYRSRLKKNLSLNGLNNDVTIIEWAVSDAQGEVPLFTDGVGGFSPSLRKVGDRGAVNIKTDTIDNAIQRGEILPPDIVKLDIEGAEILALRGMHKMLSSNKAPRAIFMEVHPELLKQFASSSAEVIEFVESFGYREIYFVESHNQIHYTFAKDT